MPTLLSTPRTPDSHRASAARAGRPGFARPGFARRRARQTGFNFTEVLFAVMILGIGFIMVAAIFPVAIQQTKLTGEEVQASTTARGGVNYAQQMGLTAYALPVTVLTLPPIMIREGETRSIPGMVSSLRDRRVPDPDGTGPIAAEDVRDVVWRQMSGNLILPSDNRAGFVVMYRRGVTFYNDPANTAIINGAVEPPGPLAHGSPFVQRSSHAYAQVYIVGVQARSTGTFELDRDTRRWPNDGPGPSASPAPGTLEPREVYVKLYEGDLNPDRLTFHVSDAPGSALLDVEAAAEGAYVVISDDRFPVGIDGDTTTTLVQESYGLANGRIYRLGSRIDTGTWELMPGEDMAYSDGGTVAINDDIHENIPPRKVAPAETAPAAGQPAVAFLVGRGYADPKAPYMSAASPGAGFEGGSQATGVYAGIIPAN